MDDLSGSIVKLLQESGEPMETKEIVKTTKSTRTKVMYRLMNLRAEGKVRGKSISSGGKGVWIWWIS